MSTEQLDRYINNKANCELDHKLRALKYMFTPMWREAKDGDTVQAKDYQQMAAKSFENHGVDLHDSDQIYLMTKIFGELFTTSVWHSSPEQMIMDFIQLLAMAFDLSKTFVDTTDMRRRHLRVIREQFIEKMMASQAAETGEDCEITIKGKGLSMEASGIADFVKRENNDS